MILWRNKKNINTFWSKNVPYLELGSFLSSKLTYLPPLCKLVNIYYGIQRTNCITYNIQPNYHTVHLVFSKLLGKLVVKYVSTYYGHTFKKDQQRTYLVISDILYKSIRCGYSFKIHQQVDAIQMVTHNICLYKEVDKKYTGCNLKTTGLLE